MRSVHSFRRRKLITLRSLRLRRLLLARIYNLVGQAERLAEVALKAAADLAQHALLAHAAAVALQQSAAAQSQAAMNPTLDAADALSLQQAASAAFTQAFDLVRAATDATAQATSLAQFALLAPAKCHADIVLG